MWLRLTDHDSKEEVYVNMALATAMRQFLAPAGPYTRISFSEVTGAGNAVNVTESPTLIGSSVDAKKPQITR